MNHTQRAKKLSKYFNIFQTVNFAEVKPAIFALAADRC